MKLITAISALSLLSFVATTSLANSEEYFYFELRFQLIDAPK
jgi:hypothetical protein